MEKAFQIIRIAIIAMIAFSVHIIPEDLQAQTKSTQSATKSTQTVKKPATTTKKPAPTTTKPVQATKKPVQKPSAPAAKPKDTGTIKIGNQWWAVANLNVTIFRNGDTIPEAKTNQEWVEAGSAGKPAWCYYSNDAANGKKYGKLYNWYAVNDPRGLAPAGWSIPSEADWVTLAGYLGGPTGAGVKMKSAAGWTDANNGTNESGFNGLPGGYRVENGTFMNIGSIGTWWSATEGKPGNAFDFYLSQGRSINRSANSRLRGESVRCIKK